MPGRLSTIILGALFVGLVVVTAALVLLPVAAAFVYAPATGAVLAVSLLAFTALYWGCVYWVEKEGFGDRDWAVDGSPPDDWERE